VIHTAECPLSTGYARSLSLWSASSTVQASWHRMSDPGTVARFVPPGRAAWHATIANRISVGYEQAGYAAFPRSTWLTVDGQASIDRLAQVIVADGIPLSSVRRLTDDEVRRALNGDTSVRGICSHAQIQPKDRTDPGAGYPWDVLLDSIKRHHPDTKTPDTPQTVWGEGDTGPAVERIQRIVGATVDGDWGPKTTAAVKAWQTLHGLEPDGLWGPLCEAAASKTTIPTLTEDDMRIITDGTRTALIGRRLPGHARHPRGGRRDQGPRRLTRRRRQRPTVRRVGRCMHTGPQRHRPDRHGGGVAGRDPGRARRPDRRCEVNLLTAIPKSVRRWLYVIYAVAGPVLLWTKAHGWTGQTEIDLWIGLGSAFGFTAAANVVSQVTVAAEPPSKVTVEPLDPIVSSEGVTYPQSSDAKSDAADYDPKHDRD
jgi:peptidoglycan hydrolase-like protein with peptidoglycan-binding domain